MQREDALERLGYVMLGGNLVLLLAKAAIWYQSGSLAVGSEALNSLTDVIYSVLIVGGIYLTIQPPDFDHPHGHERIEPFVSLIVVMGIVLAGVLILWGSVDAIWHDDITVATGPWAVSVLAGAAAVKFLMYRYALGVANQYDTPSARALAVDNRNDILTAIAAVIGVGGAQIGFELLDPLVAIGVALIIIYSGITVGRRNIDYLVGAAPPDDLHDQIIERALAHPRVQGVHDVLAHYVGPEVDVSIHLEVGEDLTLAEGHDIETSVVDAIQEIPEVDDVFVHLDPKDLDEWKPGTFVVDDEE